jgi:CheY-like chemotaxis protein
MRLNRVVEMASILVGDDEPTLRRLLRATFEPDHRVAEAADGAEAFRRLLADRPDLAILDVAMPIMDGLAVCRAARAEPSLAGLGIIVLSAYASGDAALAAGADRHLRKPFSPLELFALIDEVLALCRAELVARDAPGRSPGLGGADANDYR